MRMENTEGGRLVHTEDSGEKSKDNGSWFVENWAIYKHRWPWITRIWTEPVYTRARSVVSTLCGPMDCKPARVLCPWTFPGRNTTVGHHFLLQGINLLPENTAESLASPALAGGFFTTSATRETLYKYSWPLNNTNLNWAGTSDLPPQFPLTLFHLWVLPFC